MIDALDSRLDNIEKNLKYFSDRILEEQEVKLFHPKDKTFITETSEFDGLRTQRSSKGCKSVDYSESIIESRKRSLEYCTFPGFHQKESIELPSQLETPPILDRVTRAQDFNKSQNENKDLIFDRIADSFVALFTTINKDVKDKVLAVYPDCYAQALYAIYSEAFPESTPIFDDQFKQYLINLAHEWITGLKPVPATYNNWDILALHPSVTKGNKTDDNVVAAKQMIQAAALNKDVTITLDMDSFNKMIEKLGVEKSPIHSPSGFHRDITKTTLTSSSPLPVPSIPQSRTVVPHKPKQLESHQIGPGPDYERVKFNTQGRSPLISHYLYMRQLRDLKQPGQKVRRTEIAKMPYPL
ncbi:hypothetical protein LOTGIDRAFT_162435 [Lottia gigantea]|uniref:Uncharacterized protein n=1 Tax=Lottia gigantea TaxID=225164 RepID=V4ABS1_LOTGI|nr:hypothetical protein LOTGIDRAFT_162435 [Lottia gigantea]ESO92530.1 hypothetical protein LOTGIDRAFT_162435 [Lottia gigantea]